MESSSKSIAEQFRHAVGLPEKPSHVDDITDLEPYEPPDEPEGGYDGDPDRGAGMGLGHEAVESGESENPGRLVGPGPIDELGVDEDGDEPVNVKTETEVADEKPAKKEPAKKAEDKK